MKSFQMISIVTVAGLCFGCTQDSGGDLPEAVDPLGPGEVAIVDGDRIPESMFRLFTLNAVQANVEDLTPEGREEIIERLVYLQLLAKDGERNGLDLERRIAAELELQRMQILARAMTERYVEDNPPTESELRDLYELNLPRLSSPEYKTRHILVETEAEAAGLIEELNQGADFAELAREHSTGPTGPEGGDLGWASAESYVEPFAEAVMASTPGIPVDAPVETQYGWHVILVEEKQDQVAPGLEAVRQDLIVAVESQKLDAYANDLRETAEVTIVE